MACKEVDREITFGSFEESPQVEFLEKLVLVEDLQWVGFLAMENRQELLGLFSKVGKVKVSVGEECVCLTTFSCSRIFLCLGCISGIEN